MKSSHITRRVFIGSSVCVVSIEVLDTEAKKANELLKVLGDGQFFSARELTVLVDITEIMIPKTLTPGAIDAQVAVVVDGMMVTWAGEKTKAQFVSCLKSVQELSMSSYGQSYESLAHQKRLALINHLDKAAFNNKLTPFYEGYRKLKEIVFHVYYSSKEANWDYKLIPGVYRGCVTKKQLVELLDVGV